MYSAVLENHNLNQILPQDTLQTQLTAAKSQPVYGKKQAHSQAKANTYIYCTSAYASAPIQESQIKLAKQQSSAGTYIHQIQKMASYYSTTHSHVSQYEIIGKFSTIIDRHTSLKYQQLTPLTQSQVTATRPKTIFSTPSITCEISLCTYS